MTRGKVGHYWRRISTDPFEPVAVVLTSGSSYSIPSGATVLEAWAVGAGATVSANSAGGGGGIAYKSWTVNDQSSVSYSVASSPNINNGDTPQSTTVTFSAQTISGTSGDAPGGGSASGGSINSNGGGRDIGFINNELYYLGGGAGGNQTRVASCQRTPGTNVSGLHAALALAGVESSEACGTAAAFGSGAAVKIDSSTGAAFPSHQFSAGLGGGGAAGGAGGNGAVVLYFT